jgi:RHS repeat-associated protein
MQKWNGWVFEYDAEGRMTRACQSTTDCSGLYNELEFTYDGDGHRTQLKKYDSGNGTAVATWDFRYQGEALVEEKLTDATHAGVVVRSYVVDEAGSVVKMTIAAGEPDAGTYLVTWNGHGDALGLWRIDLATGGLTLANSFTYGTWGQPTTATANGFPDLGFRFLYVGEYDVQWDNLHGLGLYYMHARHYAPALGRFIQPDPDASEDNLYAYTANNPVTEIDPEGTCFIVCAIVGAVVSVAIYAATTDSSQWNLGDAVREGAVGALLGATGVGLISKLASVGRIASALARGSRVVSRGASIVSRSSRVGATAVRTASRVKKAVAPYLRDQRSDWIRFGRTKVSNQLIKGPGAKGYSWRNAIKGGGRNPKTGVKLPFHYHIGLYNLTRPSTWFRQTRIL